tara:strand:+ start:446 stop:553 length:108 start_codon:yes stop_codon:yes gene_type:complete
LPLLLSDEFRDGIRTTVKRTPVDVVVVVVVWTIIV